MAGFQKIDKKQLPQVIGLGVASAGLFGYFAFKMMAPTVSAAPPPAASASTPPVGTATAATGAAATPGDATAAAATASGGATDAPPPTPGMRNPFVPLIGTVVSATAAPAAPAAPAPVRVATANASAGGPAVPAGFGPLPAVTPVSPGAPGGIAPIVGTGPMPVAPPAAPAWTVTGVLQSGTENVAVLRNGSERQYVHPGDSVGGTFRVVDVTRQFVVLRHGDQRYTLPLGGVKTPAKPGPTVTVGTPAPSTPTPDAAGQAVQTTIDQSTQETQQFQAVMQKLNALTGGAPGGAAATSVPTNSAAAGGVK